MAIASCKWNSRVRKILSLMGKYGRPELKA